LEVAMVVMPQLMRSVVAVAQPWRFEVVVVQPWCLVVAVVMAAAAAEVAALGEALQPQRGRCVERWSHPRVGRTRFRPSTKPCRPSARHKSVLQQRRCSLQS